MRKPRRSQFAKPLARWPRFVIGGLVALPLLAWGAFAWSYGAATPCRANIAAFEAYMRAQVTSGLAKMGRSPGAVESAALATFMKDAHTRVDGMSQLECWDDLRHSEWAAGG
ncbi:MAG: hypothetical protein EXQ88_07540 [Alphaproteobacteria bacterium]|nr:hypothetical protein [Alphaproteobacteria bacterium]